LQKIISNPDKRMVYTTNTLLLDEKNT